MDVYDIDELSEILIPQRKMVWLLEWVRSMFTIRFSVDDLSPIELDKLCGVIENRIHEGIERRIRCGRYPQVVLNSTILSATFQEGGEVKMSLIVTF